MSQTSSGPPAAVSLRGPLLGGLAVGLLVVVVFWDFFLRQIRWAIQEQADWGHTLVVPFIAGYFVYLNREKLLARPFRTTWVGFLPIVLGVGIYTIAVVGPEVLHHHNLRGFGVALTISGLALLFCGFRAMVWLWFPLLYLFVFGQTISERVMGRLTFELQGVTAVGAELFFTLIGLDCDREGNTLFLWDDGVQKPLNIAEACSGMRMLMAFMALGVAMAYTGLKRNWQRVLMVIMGVPTAIFVNVLRVVSLGLLSLIDSEFAAGDFHSFIGLVWLVPAFVIYLGVIWVIRQTVTEVPDAPGPSPAGGS